MIGLLQAGYSALVLGLSFMIIWSALNITSTNTPANSRQLKIISWVVIVIGILIIILGLFRIGIFGLFVGPPQEGNIILATGSAVFSLGFASLLRIIGHGHERVIWGWSLIITGIGIGFIASYLIVVYWLKS